VRVHAQAQYQVDLQLWEAVESTKAMNQVGGCASLLAHLPDGARF
jgi:hypothetical protein